MTTEDKKEFCVKYAGSGNRFGIDRLKKDGFVKELDYDKLMILQNKLSNAPIDSEEGKKLAVLLTNLVYKILIKNNYKNK